MLSIVWQSNASRVVSMPRHPMYTAVCHPGALNRHLLPVSDSQLNAVQRAWVAFLCIQILSATCHDLDQAVHEQAGDEQ